MSNPNLLRASALLILSLSVGVTAPRAQPKPTSKPLPMATEVLRIVPDYVGISSQGHGYMRCLTRVQVVAVGRTASGVSVGDSLLIVFGFKPKDKDLPPSKGKLYRALLFKDPSSTTEDREPIYRPTNELKSFVLIPK